MNIRELLQDLNIEFKEAGQHHHTSQGWISIDCMYCSPGWRHFRLGINTAELYANCWQCGRVNIRVALANISGRPINDIYRLLKEVKGEYRDQIEKRGVLKIPVGVMELQQPHMKYLRSRSFEPLNLVRLWDIRGIGINARFNWRIFIPIHYRGRIVSWTTRAIIDQGTRYVSAKPIEEELNHKELLYGEDYCRHSVIVVEGPTDVWNVGPGAVATFGTAFSTAQVEKLSKYPIRVVCFDPEIRAQRKAKQLCSLLEPFPGETYNIELETGDPGSASREEIRELRKRFFGE